jgi:hypothetical protein
MCWWEWSLRPTASQRNCGNEIGDKKMETDPHNRPDNFPTVWSGRQDHLDTIKRGDRVSWRPDDEQRSFGRVVRRCVKDYQPAFSVREDGTGMGHIILARDITKEVG